MHEEISILLFNNLFQVILTERNSQMQYGRHKVPEPKRPVFSHVSQNQGGQHVAAELEPNFEQGVAQPLGLQNARLLLRVILEGRLPELEAAHEVFEVAEFQPPRTGSLRREVKG